MAASVSQSQATSALSSAAGQVLNENDFLQILIAEFLERQ